MDTLHSYKVIEEPSVVVMKATVDSDAHHPAPPYFTTDTSILLLLATKPPASSNSNVIEFPPFSSSFNLKTLNLNNVSIMNSGGSGGDQQLIETTMNAYDNTYDRKLPVSCSSSSIALLNAKSKALKNLKRSEAHNDDGYKTSYLIDNMKSNYGYVLFVHYFFFYTF